MKKILSRLFILTCAFAFCLCGTAKAQPIDISETIILERFTLVDGITFQYDEGFLLLNGQFEILTTELGSYSTYGLTPDDLAPISGKPIINKMLYQAYHTQGVIPKWTRSQRDFILGLITYVTVAVSGIGDPNPAITIITQPQNQRVLLGSSALFLVEAEPYLYLSYQWYFKNKPIPGEVGSGLLLSNVTQKQVGLYKVSLSTGSVPLMSQNVYLQVVLPVSVKKQPKSATVKAGKNVTFRVTANGTGPFTYQWSWNGNTITNAINSFYVVSNAQPTNSGAYRVLIDNGLSQVLSSIAVLTVK
jgi:hypothetical protein